MALVVLALFRTCDSCEEMKAQIEVQHAAAWVIGRHGACSKVYGASAVHWCKMSFLILIINHVS